MNTFLPVLSGMHIRREGHGVGKSAKGSAALDAVYHYTIQAGDITKPWLSLKVGCNKAHVMVFTVQ